MLKEAQRRTGLAAALLGLWLATTSPLALALTYRCELPSHQVGAPPEVRYQGQPCDGGRALHDTDRRTDAQRADIHKATQANAKLAQQLERERRRHEKQGAGRPPIAMDHPAPVAKPAASSTQGQTLKRARPFTARTPKALPAKQHKTSG